MARSRVTSRPDGVSRAARLALLLCAGLASAAPAAAPADTLRAARAAAGRCAYGEAAAGAKAAIAAVGADVGLELVAQQDLATFANELSDPQTAEASARRAVALATAKFGAGSIEAAIVQQNLAVALAARDRRDEARPIFEHIIATTGGPRPDAAATAEIGYSDFLYNAGDPQGGYDHAQRAAVIARTAGLPPALKVQALLRAADADRRAQRFEEARKAADEAAALIAANPGTRGAPRLALVRIAIAYEMGRFDEALTMLAALEPAVAQGDPCDPTLGVDVAHRRGTIHMLRREVPEARAAFNDALARLTGLRLANNPRSSEIVYGLAVAAAQAREFDTAGNLFDRAASAFRTAYGRPSQAEAEAYQEKALMLGGAGRGDQAVAAARNAAALLDQAAGVSPLARAYSQATLGLSYKTAGMFPEAERALGTALTGFEQARGRDSFDLTPGLTALGEIALARRRTDLAQAYLRRALAIQDRLGGGSAIASGVTLSRLAEARAAAGGRVDALALSARAVGVLRKRLALGEARPWSDIETEKRSARSILVADATLVTAPIAPATPSSDAATVARLFEVGQIANATRTGAAIAELASRMQAPDPAFSAMLRQRGDLANEWRMIQQQLVTGLETGGMGDAERGAMLARQQQVERDLASLDQRIIARDPRIEDLLRSRTIRLDHLQRTLRPAEAALSFFVGEAQSFAVVATRDRALAYRIAVGGRQLDQQVQQLRATVDVARWMTPDAVPAYDMKNANALYRQFFEPAVRELTGIETLLVVADGALSGIPAAPLLTAIPPDADADAPDYAHWPFLVRQFAFAYYPSIASLVALREIPARGEGASFLGVGDPTLTEGTGEAAERGPDTFASVLASTRMARLANPRVLNLMAPLPDTRTELTSMSSLLGRPDSQLMLGDEASEGRVRRADLRKFGVIAFATHGLVAGDLQGYAEPALLMTPPTAPSEADDGLLSASEITQLNLRAQWVILSACNTAAGEDQIRAEPLSGLAKAFFYAGARSLLVSHWPVSSAVTADLTVATLRARSGGITAARALQTAEIALIDDPNEKELGHPFYWAPFILAGGD